MVKVILLGQYQPPMEELVVGCTYDTLLVFESTLAGIRAARIWLDKNPTPCGRVDIPYCRECGDYLTHRQRECVHEANGRLLALSPSHEFQIVPTCVDWCAATLRAMEDDLLLRDPLSGLSVVQQYMMGLTGDVAEIHAACSARFQLPIQTIRRQHATMGAPRDLDMLPHALVGGAYPIDIVACCRLLREYFVDGRHDRWSTQGPYCIDYRFERDLDGRWVSVAVRDEYGEVVGLPYGVLPSEFAQANPGCDKTGWTPRYSAGAVNLCSVPVCWDPEFLGARYETVDEYMHFWIEQKKRLWATKLCEIEDNAKKDVLRRDFIRTLHLGTMCSAAVGHVPAILGESRGAKRRRIRDCFGDHQEFLDIPVGDINSDNGEILDEDAMPMESGRDLWMRNLPF